MRVLLAILLFGVTCAQWNANIKILSRTSSTIRVGWDKVDKAIGYNLYVDGENAGTSVVERMSKNSLKPNSTHDFQLTWTDSNGIESEKSSKFVTRTLNSGIGRMKVEISQNGKPIEYYMALKPEFTMLIPKANYTAIAYVNPTQSGSYRFELTGTNSPRVQLYLSTDKTASNKKLIAYLNKQSTVKDKPESDPLNLDASKQYYIELVATEGELSYVGIQWIYQEQKTPIPITALSPVMPYNVKDPNFDTEVMEALKNAVSGHPRALGGPNRFEIIRKTAASSSWYQGIKAEADNLLTKPLIVYPSGNVRGLSQARDFNGLTAALGLVYQITKNDTYAQRLKKEMLNVAAFPDWKFDEQFLAVSEFTFGAALGLDWAWDTYTQQERDLIATSMLKNGFEKAIGVYENTLIPKNPIGPWPYWPTALTNWNFVCNGGIGIALLTVLNDFPHIITQEQQTKIIQHAVKGVDIAIGLFSPDGAWFESLSYYAYSMSYATRFLATLENTLGTDFGVSNSYGFSSSADTFASFTGADNWYYGDSPTHEAFVTGFYWFAGRFHNGLAKWQHGSQVTNLFTALYESSLSETNSKVSQPLDSIKTVSELSGENWVTFRSNWTNNGPTAVDTDDFFLGIKAGHPGVDPTNTHSHLDTGSFVLDAYGKRWLHDLGSNNYEAPGIWNATKGRWDYYKLRAEGHNCIVINPDANADQTVGSASKMVAFSTKPHKSFTIADISPAYKHIPSVKSVHRGVMFTNRDTFLLQDEIESSTEIDLYSFFHFNSSFVVAANGKMFDNCDSINLSASEVTLVYGEVSLILKVVEPKNAEISMMKAVPLPSSPNPSANDNTSDFCKLVLHFKGVTSPRIAMFMMPLPTSEEPPTSWPIIKPLSQWN